MKPESPTLSLITAYAFGAEHGLQQEIESIRNMVIEWDLSYTSSLRRGFIVELFEKHGIFEEFRTKFWPFGNTASGEAKRRRYLSIKKRYEDFLAGRGSDEEGAGEQVDEEEAEQAFAAESDLRDFLAEHLSCIEPGLRLHESGENSGVEYAIDNGFIDILAIDREGRFVVIELKVGRGRNRTIGQLLYYMGWIDANMGKSPCRGIIIAKEIPDDLMLAVQRAPGVSLCRYHLAVSVESVWPKR